MALSFLCRDSKSLILIIQKNCSAQQHSFSKKFFFSPQTLTNGSKNWGIFNFVAGLVRLTLTSLYLSTLLLWEDPSLSDIVLHCVTSFGQLENGKCDLGKGLKRAYVLRLPTGNSLTIMGRSLCQSEMVRCLWSPPSCHGTDFHIYK